ncbi:hypothetical protein ADUPG1_011102 [Aduncisulcus paluster]|uniref:Uncharacterized protein n=1 Tax=Aduncisulcus paluster TaxID=2918883 RepID=A0ABQ5JZB2_9EUKA|nr:hypothetical protein ADUPG1_011102 [Aduncisulcus paluster]
MEYSKSQDRFSSQYSRFSNRQISSQPFPHVHPSYQRESPIPSKHAASLSFQPISRKKKRHKKKSSKISKPIPLDKSTTSVSLSQPIPSFSSSNHVVSSQPRSSTPISSSGSSQTIKKDTSIKKDRDSYINWSLEFLKKSVKGLESTLSKTISSLSTGDEWLKRNYDRLSHIDQDIDQVVIGVKNTASIQSSISSIYQDIVKLKSELRSKGVSIKSDNSSLKEMVEHIQGLKSLVISASEQYSSDIKSFIETFSSRIETLQKERSLEKERRNHIYTNIMTEISSLSALAKPIITKLSDIPSSMKEVQSSLESSILTHIQRSERALKQLQTDHASQQIQQRKEYEDVLAQFRADHSSWLKWQSELECKFSETKAELLRRMTEHHEYKKKKFDEISDRYSLLSTNLSSRHVSSLECLRKELEKSVGSIREDVTKTLSSLSDSLHVSSLECLRKELEKSVGSIREDVTKTLSSLSDSLSDSLSPSFQHILSSIKESSSKQIDSRVSSLESSLQSLIVSKLDQQAETQSATILGEMSKGFEYQKDVITSFSQSLSTSLTSLESSLQSLIVSKLDQQAETQSATILGEIPSLPAELLRRMTEHHEYKKKKFDEISDRYSLLSTNLSSRHVSSLECLRKELEKSVGSIREDVTKTLSSLSDSLSDSLSPSFQHILSSIKESSSKQIDSRVSSLESSLQSLIVSKLDQQAETQSATILGEMSKGFEYQKDVITSFSQSLSTSLKAKMKEISSLMADQMQGIMKKKGEEQEQEGSVILTEKMSAHIREVLSSTVGSDLVQKIVLNQLSLMKERDDASLVSTDQGNGQHHHKHLDDEPFQYPQRRQELTDYSTGIGKEQLKDSSGCFSSPEFPSSQSMLSSPVSSFPVCMPHTQRVVCIPRERPRRRQKKVFVEADIDDVDIFEDIG